jgi:hypothetical protein
MFDGSRICGEPGMSAADEREARTGEQTLLRVANDGVLGRSGANPVDVAEFVCECGDGGCRARVVVTLREYAEIRADPSLLVVAPGHLPEQHELLYRCPGYMVVVRTQIQ